MMWRKLCELNTTIIYMIEVVPSSHDFLSEQSCFNLIQLLHMKSCQVNDLFKFLMLLKKAVI